MASIKLAIENSQAIDVETRNADDLLAELVGGHERNDDDLTGVISEQDHVGEDHEGNQVSLDGGEGIADGKVETPRECDPQILALATEANLHSIPRIGNQPESNNPPPQSNPRENPASPVQVNK